MSSRELPKAYDPKSVEEKWYDFWLEKKYFHADENAGGASFSIVIPPPNVTGSLHIGHALNSTLQDILIRWMRMSGRNTLWVPGTDHAGIATQNVVERQLAKEHIDRHQLGREKFIEKVWEWKTGIRQQDHQPTEAASARPVTGTVNGSPWTQACRKPCARSLSRCMKKGSSTAASG